MSKQVVSPFSIDDALDNVDLSFKNYTPSEQALEFWAIARLIKGEDFDVPNPLLHYWLVDLAFNNIEREQYPYSQEINSSIKINPRKLAIMMGRGLAKSTTMTLFLVLYMAIKGELPGTGKVHFVLGIGDAQDSGAKVMANTIRDICEESVFVKEFFESVRFTDTECEFLRRGTTPASKRTFMFKVKGAQGGVRGIRHKGERVDVILPDDIVKNEQDAHSETIMSAIKNTIYSDAINSMRAQGGKIILIGTPMNKNDVVYSAIESGSWTPVVIPLCEKIELDMPKKDFVGAWPNMHTYERMLERYEDAVGSNATRAFNQELMLRISGEDDRMITDDMLEWYDRKVLLKDVSAYNIYITTDFTTTSEAKSDFSGALAWAVNNNGDFYLVDVVLRRHGIAEQYDALFEMVSFWARQGKSVEVGVEKDGQQGTHIFALKEMMLKRSEWFQFAKQKGAKYGSEGILSRKAGGNKHERFRLMLPQFQNHKIHFPNELKDMPDMKELLKQLKYTTYIGFMGADDGIDCISQLNMIDIRYPSISADRYADSENKRSSIWADSRSYTDNDSAYSSYA